jgi:tRNA 2-selenouridine synthase
MIEEIDIADFLQTNTPLIDVRSPDEYQKGHIPGAVNIPLFSDAERAHIGTVYVQQSPEKAIALGYKYVHPKLPDFILQSREVAPDGDVAVHCWRGGMRSHSFALHLHDHGLTKVSVITGGYKAFRKHALHMFDEPYELRIVGGYTGSGKTQVLQELSRMGAQVVALEELARHKGSAFGDTNQPQPTVEQFENDLFDKWRKLNPKQPVWLEDESHNIGGVTIPMGLFQQMRASTVYFLDVSKEERALHLVEEYAGASVEYLAGSICRISKRLGGQNTALALKCLNERKFYEVALLILTYYDKSYLKGMRFHEPEKVFVVKGYDTSPSLNAKAIIKQYEQHERYKTHAI